jgi:hypothetical protein
MSSSVVCLATLNPTNVEWLWPGRLAAGKLTLLDGDPDQGKSLVTLDWAARLTTARPWPDGAPIGQPESVLLLGGEDNLFDTVIPRLLAAGADLNRVHILHGQPGPDGAFLPPVFPADADLLRNALKETGARFVVADPIVAYLGAAGGLNGPQVRKALTPLANIAEEARANLTMVRHLNKSGGRRSAMYRGMGSIAVVAAARVDLLVGRDPGDPSLRVLACTKNNLAGPQPTLGYRIGHDEMGRPFLNWTGPVPVSADEIVLNDGTEYGTSLGRAVEFLRETLAREPRPSKEVKDLATELGIAPRTLKRARQELNVVPCQIWENGRNVWYWRMALGATPEEEIRLMNEELLRQWGEQARDVPA